MDDPNITMEEYIRLEEEKAHRRGKVYNWETATHGKIWYDEDVHDLRFVETEFPAMVFNDTLTSEQHSRVSLCVGVLKSQDGCSTRNLAHKCNLENLPSKYQGSFSF
ncbi:hypothetical protein Tco_0991848 [Tanacetum coccineum]|uniref:Uncharacterized protein n=1 Tax=Tanacetum coccineum TaxID=301880 RepID=A0ABQ5F1H3_9ASTR